MADVSLLKDYAVVGSPDAIDKLSQDVTNLASTVHNISQRLNSDTLVGSWSGDAAKAFHDLLHETPTMLEQARGSFEDAGATLTGYGGKLRTHVNVAQTLAGELEQALAAQRSAAQRLGSAQQDVRSALQSAADAGSDPSAQAHAQAAVDGAGSRLNGAESALASADGEIARIMGDAATNRSKFEDAVSECCRRLDHALDIGFKNSLGSAWDRYAGDIGGVAAALASIVVKAWSLGGDFVAWIQHPTLEGFHKILEDVGAVLTIVAFVGLVALAVFQPETSPLLIAFTEGAVTTAVVGGRIVGGGEVGIDAVQIARGKGTVWDIGFDSLGFFGASKGARTWAGDLAKSQAEKEAAAAARAAGQSARTVGGHAGWARRYVRYSGLPGYSATGPGGLVGARAKEFAIDNVKDGGTDWANAQANDYLPLGQTQLYAVNADAATPLPGNSLFQRLTHISIGALAPAPAPA